MSRQTEKEFVQDILKRTADYLDVLAGNVFDIEKTVSKNLAQRAEYDDLTIRNLQGLDFLRQSLEDLALLAVLLLDFPNTPLSEDKLAIVSTQLKLKSTRILLGERPIEQTSPVSGGIDGLDLF